MARMTDDEVLALMMLLTAERPVQARAIGEGLTGRLNSEGARAQALSVLRSLRRGGAAARIAGSHSPWEITEKGRIAAALLMYKDPELRQIFIDDWIGTGSEGAGSHLGSSPIADGGEADGPPG